MHSPSTSNLAALRDQPRSGLSITYQSQRPYASATDTPPLRSFPRDGQRAVFPGSAAGPAQSPRSGAMAIPDEPRPSAVPSKGRRRESMGAQLRKGTQLALSPTSPSALHAHLATAPASASHMAPKPSYGIAGASDSHGHHHATPRTSAVAIAAGAGGAPAPRSFVRRASATPAGLGELSTSLGAAAHHLSSPGPGLGGGVPCSVPSSVPRGSFGDRHTHFGAECFGPSSLDTSLPDMPPSAAALAQLRATAETREAEGAARPAAASSAATKDKEDHTVHRCEACAKVYRHPSCLIKHRWEHTVYWKEASKFLLSKHQQVQLLEAAAILVGMDSEATSLPEEKALWPAAVSPPSSGLLGSDMFNYDRLMEARAQRRSTSVAAQTQPSTQAQTQAQTQGRGPTPAAARDRTCSGTSHAPSLSLSLSPTRQLQALQLVDAAPPMGAAGAAGTAVAAQRPPAAAPLPSWRSTSRDSLATAVSSARMGGRTSKSPSPPESDAADAMDAGDDAAAAAVPPPREAEVDNVFGDLDMDE